LTFFSANDRNRPEGQEGKEEMKRVNRNNKEQWLKSALRYTKKPIPIRAVQMSEQFLVETNEGTMKGKAGDWLIEGIMGEVYPHDAQTFVASYEEANQ